MPKKSQINEYGDSIKCQMNKGDDTPSDQLKFF